MRCYLHFRRGTFSLSLPLFLPLFTLVENSYTDLLLRGADNLNESVLICLIEFQLYPSQEEVEIRSVRLSPRTVAREHWVPVEGIAGEKRLGCPSEMNSGWIDCGQRRTANNALFHLQDSKGDIETLWNAVTELWKCGVF